MSSAFGSPLAGTPDDAEFVVAPKEEVRTEGVGEESEESLKFIVPKSGTSGLEPPFTYFGGKRRVAEVVWSRFGDVRVFLDPFMGALAIPLARPQWSVVLGDWYDGRPRYELVNDISCMVVNFYRAVGHDPDEVARWADNPPFENDFHARHVWLLSVQSELRARLEGNPDYYDVKIAGWWVWATALSIGGRLCNGEGPWVVRDGKLVKDGTGKGSGLTRKLIHCSSTSGVVATRSKSPGIFRSLPCVANCRGTFADHYRVSDNLRVLFNQLSRRVSKMYVTCGDWKRVCCPAVLGMKGPIGILLDPPYSMYLRSSVYTDEMESTEEVRAFALEQGSRPDVRVALCGYFEEHDNYIPSNWERFRWKASGGYGNCADPDSETALGRRNAERECIWFSPACEKPIRTIF